MAKDYFLVIYLDEVSFNCASAAVKNIEDFRLEESAKIFNTLVEEYYFKIKQLIDNNADQIKTILNIKELKIEGIYDFDADDSTITLILELYCDELDDFTNLTKIIYNLIEDTAIENIGEVEINDKLVDYSFSLKPNYVGIYEDEVDTL